MNKKIGAITRAPSLVCKQCAEQNNRIITEWAWSTGYPNGYTCDDCGNMHNKDGEIINK